MKQKYRIVSKIRFGSVLLLVAATPLLAAKQASAASATIYLSPASGSYYLGGSLTVSVRENSGSEPVNGVQANISYPASQLKFVSIGSSSAFSVAAQSSGGNGSIQVARGALPAVSGDQLVATVQFTVLSGTGTASLAFAGGTSVTDAQSNADITSGKVGASYALRTPVVPPPAPPPPLPPAPKPVTISDIKVSAITPTSATINWTTSVPSTSEVDYGLNSNYGIVWTDAKQTATHSALLNSPVIIPGTTYHYMIKAKDAYGNTGQSSDAGFETGGATLVITVIDQHNNKPVSGATVSYGTQKTTTNTMGRATLTDLPEGTVTFIITVGGKPTAESVVIGKAALDGQSQTVSFKLASSTTSSNRLYFAVLALLCLLGIGMFAGFRLRRHKSISGHTLTPDVYGPAAVTTAPSPAAQPTGNNAVTPAAPATQQPVNAGTQAQQGSTPEVSRQVAYPRADLSKYQDHQ